MEHYRMRYQDTLSTYELLYLSLHFSFVLSDWGRTDSTFRIWDQSCPLCRRKGSYDSWVGWVLIFLIFRFTPFFWVFFRVSLYCSVYYSKFDENFLDLHRKQSFIKNLVWKGKIVFNIKYILWREYDSSTFWQ